MGAAPLFQASRARAQVRRAAEQLARASRKNAVVVLIDNAERLHPSLLHEMLYSLMHLKNSHVLAITLSDAQTSAVIREDLCYWHHGVTLGVDARMGEDGRRAVALGELPDSPTSVILTLGAAAENYSEIIGIARSAGSARMQNDSDALDAIAAFRSMRDNPTSASAILAFLGGRVTSAPSTTSTAAPPTAS